jgi:hypothetical protein
MIDENGADTDLKFDLTPTVGDSVRGDEFVFEDGRTKWKRSIARIATAPGLVRLITCVPDKSGMKCPWTTKAHTKISFTKMVFKEPEIVQM